MLEGPSFDLYDQIINECSNESHDQSIKLIASGGITSISDLIKLNEMGCEGAIIGKALYEGHINLRDLERYI